MIYDITSEQSESSVWNDALDSSVHALLETDWSITFIVSIFAGRVLVVARSISGGVGSAADGLRAVVVCSFFVEGIYMNVAVVHNLDWALATWGWSFFCRFW